MISATANEKTIEFEPDDVFSQKSEKLKQPTKKMSLDILSKLKALKKIKEKKVMPGQISELKY